MQLSRAFLGENKANKAKARAEHQARGLRTSITRAAETTHGAWAMGLKPTDCFDVNDETEWLLPSSIDMKDGTSSSDDGSLSESGSDDASPDDDASDSGSQDGASDNGEAFSESGSDEDSGAGSDQGPDAVEDDALAGAASRSFFHRRANNTIAQMAVYCGYEQAEAGEAESAESAESDPGSERAGGASSAPKPKKASVGKLRQLLAKIHKKNFRKGRSHRPMTKSQKPNGKCSRISSRRSPC